ncbi:MAG: hypothetical protein GTN71_01535 [Anaerolineae bacterium]|nr:hypothetical protein [Anaerolineae bacterium]
MLIAKSLSERSAEAAPTPVLSPALSGVEGAAEGPPGCRAWEPGLLVFGKVS